MVSSFFILKKKEYLVMTIQGTYDYLEFMELPQQIFQECKNHDCHKTLVDLSAVTADEISLIELFFIGEKIADVLGNKIMMAMVWKRESLSDFLVDVATNRSARLKVFATQQRAEYWLLNKC
jgi:hypothetical protein